MTTELEFDPRWALPISTLSIRTVSVSVLAAAKTLHTNRTKVKANLTSESPYTLYCSAFRYGQISLYTATTASVSLLGFGLNSIFEVASGTALLQLNAIHERDPAYTATMCFCSVTRLSPHRIAPDYTSRSSATWLPCLRSKLHPICDTNPAEGRRALAIKHIKQGSLGLQPCLRVTRREDKLVPIETTVCHRPSPSPLQTPCSTQIG